MADNVAITAGLGTTIATDEIGGAHYQFVKLVLGPLDTATLIAAGQQAAAACVPVVLASDKALPVPDGTCLATAVTIGTSAGTLPATNLANRKRLTVQNRGSSSIFLGGSGVTTSTGVEIQPGGDSGELEIGATSVLYAISAAAGQDVRVLERA